jgi:diguanylate cyclase (GGDEF)-like protein
MPPPPLERVVSCPKLPTLPAVALKVIELTRDPNVSIQTIAATIQNDPALTAKVLKTINSAYYALSHPCPSIARACSMLGLNAVKAIVLGFSLVDATKPLRADGRFDLDAYWRRGIFAAASARVISLATRACDPEEAFVGAMVIDIGVLAAFTALQEEYARILDGAVDDHDDLAQLEEEALGFDHMMAGKMMGERWKLPPQLVECIAKHHTAERASVAHEKLVRIVHLSTLCAGALTVVDSQKKLGQLIVKSRNWFGLDPAQTRELVQQAAKGAGELSKLLGLNTGAKPDIEAIMRQAHEQMIDAQEAVQEEQATLRRTADELVKKTITDGLTGVGNRAHYTERLAALQAEAFIAKQPLSLVFIDADRFKSVNDTHGHQAGDAVLIELARRLNAAASRIGVVCRYGGEEFAIIIPKVGLDKAFKIADMIRQSIAKTPFDLSPHGIALTLPVTISMGVAAIEPGTPTQGWSPDELTRAADAGVYAAKKDGRNRVSVAPTESIRHTASAQAIAASTPAGTQAIPPGQTSNTRLRVLIVDDDALACKMVAILLNGIEPIAQTVAHSADAGRAAAASGTFDIILVNAQIDGGGIEFFGSLSTVPASASAVRVLLAKAGDDATRTKAVAAGVKLVVPKADLAMGDERLLKAILAAPRVAAAA